MPYIIYTGPFNTTRLARITIDTECALDFQEPGGEDPTQLAAEGWRLLQTFLSFEGLLPLADPENYLDRDGQIHEDVLIAQADVPRLFPGAPPYRQS